MLHFIINPIAHTIKLKRLCSLIEKKAEQAKREYLIHCTERIGHAGESAAELSRTPDTIIAVVGGDGTLHEVLNGIENFENVTLALVPCGTGNDFAEAIGIPSDLEKALDTVFFQEAKDTDWLQIGNKRSINVAGLGMDVDVLERCYRGRLKGKIKYLLSLLQSIFLFKGYEVEYTIGDETKRYNALFACACNGRQIGGGIRICPVADVQDGKLDFVFVHWHKGVELIKSFLSLMRGKFLSSSRCEHILCDKVVIRPVERASCQLDGELYSDLSFEAEIKTGLKFIRP